MFMLKRFGSTVLFLLLLAMSAAAETVRISGSAPGYEGRKLAVILPVDEFSGFRQLMVSTDIRDDASFQIEFELKEIRRVYIHIQRIEASLYAVPGSSYTCVFPQVAKSDFKRFDRSEVDLQLVDLPQDDLNALIRRYNADYTRFIAEHFYDFAAQEYRGSTQYMSTLQERRLKVDLFAKKNAKDTLQNAVAPVFERWVKHFCDSMESVYSGSNPSEFFQVYREFSEAELFLLKGMNRVQFYNRYIRSRALPLNNPAFVSCFKLYYQNLLTGRKSELQARIIKAINADRSLQILTDVFLSDSTLQSSRIRRLACVNGLKDVYYNKSFDRSAIEMMLRQPSDNDPELDSIAAHSYAQLTRCKGGTAFPELVLTDEAQERWSVSQLAGVPVYLYFFATWSPNSLKELQLLERWKEKFQGRIEFIGVSMDDDYSDFRKYLEEHPKQTLDFVYGNADPFIQEKLKLKAVPHAFLIDERGFIAVEIAPSPSDAKFEAALNQLAIAPADVRQKPKTWKDH
jgi:thiol-disulfide isomerase/thioredoxin